MPDKTPPIRLRDDLLDPIPLESKLAESEWFSTRPLPVQKAIRKKPPHIRYRLKQTGQIVRIHSYDEPYDGSEVTVKVDVLGHERGSTITEGFRVFGIHLDDLEPLPET